MRTEKELFKLMLEHKDKFALGLCAWSIFLNCIGIITYDELKLLLDYIDHNRPSKFSSLSVYKNRNRPFYWEIGDITPRIKWINKQIEKL